MAQLARRVGHCENKRANGPARKKQVKKTEKGGAPAKYCVATIMEHWVDCADFDGRVIQSMSHLSKMISGKIGVPPRTVLRWKPSTIRKVGATSDLCSACELLKCRRLFHLQMTHKGTEGVRLVRNLWKQHFVTKDVPHDIEVLESHERLYMFLRDVSNEDLAWAASAHGRYTFFFDYAAAFKISSPRGTGGDFFSPTTVQYFGAYVVGGGQKKYYHVIDMDQGARHTSEHALQCSRIVIQAHLRATKCKKNTAQVRVWTDTVSYFRSREYLGGILSMCVANVRAAFHCESHGKTVVDAAFRHGRAALSEVSAGHCKDRPAYEKKLQERFETLDNHSLLFHNRRNMPRPVQLVVGKGTGPISVPYIWDRVSDGAVPLISIDLSSDRIPLVIADKTTSDNKEVLDDAHAVFKHMRPENQASKIVSSWSNKMNASRLLGNAGK